MGYGDIEGGIEMSKYNTRNLVNPYSGLIEKVVNQYGLTFHKHWTGFKDKEYKELIKFEDCLSNFYLWIYIIDGKKAHKVELRDSRTAELIAVSEGNTTPLQTWKLVKEVMKNV